MRRALLRLGTVLALGLGLLAVPFGPGVVEEAQAATSNGKIYNKDGDVVMAASFNSGLHYYHEHENASPDKPNFFQVMDKCDDGESPVVTWTIEGRAVDGWSADDCTSSSLLPFKLYAVETGYEEPAMASMQWHLAAKDADGNQLGSTDVKHDWAGSYTDDGSDLYTHASLYRDEYDTGGDTLVVTILPTDKAKGLDVAAIVDAYTAQIWDHVTTRLPRPGSVTDDQAESLYKQLWCHVRFNAYGIRGGHTWDLEAERPNIDWELVTEDIAIHGCNWGTTEDQGWFSRPPTDGGDPENLAPMVDAGPDVSVDEGSAVTLKGTAADDGGTPATEWTYTRGDDVDEGATCTFAEPTAPRTTLTCTDDGTYTVKLTADDGVNQPVSDRATVTVRNVAPTLDVTAPKEWDVHRVETEVPVVASFTDPGSNDTHTCKVTWDDGSTSDFPAKDGRCETSHVYDHAGMDTVAVEVTDDDGGTDDAERMVVVYDPRAGLASGAGTLGDGLGFTALAKYPTAGSTVPAGAVKLSVPTATGRHTIVSTDLDWLVITPDAKAAVKGRSATHGFLGYLESGRFRGVTWPLTQGNTPPAAPTYDSTPGASWDLDEAQPKPLRTGLTVIDTGWLPGLPQLPAPLGDTVGNLLNTLPTLRLDLHGDTAA
ncbi:DUF2599 domain-containing protein [Streptomyces jeddahensis]|uniref:PKD domain-containing protein n=1 Tax=Streptomyces jeddahensis TaxID=1716141 RepID=A0A177HJB2_9ACTN|nr:DUF2599 domain-containing protein [Streptomyces jeddahensis]OAH10238.1 hypothetical protein STSP_64940 [Streptomyces jeddahensis]